MDNVVEKKQLEQDFSRRQFIKAAAITVGAATVLSTAGVNQISAANKSKGLSLSTW